MAEPWDKTPRGNIIAVCILIGVMVVIGAYEWSEGNKGGGQQTAAAHHSIRSLVGGDSGSGGPGG